MFQQAEVDFTRIVHEIRVWIHFQTFAEKDFAVRTLFPAHEKYQVMPFGKVTDVGHTVGHLAANGVKRLERRSRLDVLLDVVCDLAKLFQ